MLVIIVVVAQQVLILMLECVQQVSTALKEVLHHKGVLREHFQIYFKLQQLLTALLVHQVDIVKLKD